MGLEPDSRERPAILTHTHTHGGIMKLSRFVKLIQAGSGDSDPEIDTINLDLSNFDDIDRTSVIASEPGRKEGTIKIWLSD